MQSESDQDRPGPLRRVKNHVTASPGRILGFALTCFWLMYGVYWLISR